MRRHYPALSVDVCAALKAARIHDVDAINRRMPTGPVSMSGWKTKSPMGE
jgi:hypothetical protein